MNFVFTLLGIFTQIKALAKRKETKKGKKENRPSEQVSVRQTRKVQSHPSGFLQTPTKLSPKGIFRFRQVGYGELVVPGPGQTGVAAGVSKLAELFREKLDLPL